MRGDRSPIPGFKPTAAEDGGMSGDDAGGEVDGTGDGSTTDDGPVRIWLVDRSYDDKGLVRIVYATPDGERCRRFEWAAGSLGRREVTAAREADPSDLQQVPEADREGYRTEARRMRERHEPDEEV